MTVAELIGQLQKAPPDHEVYVFTKKGKLKPVEVVEQLIYVTNDNGCDRITVLRSLA